MSLESGQSDRSRTSVSVLVPHLDQPDQLSRCLSSLKTQSFDDAPVEIVVIDNGSKVLPEAICKKFGGVRLEREETPGPGPARNKGVSVSRGDILAFIDADCIADESWIATLVNELERDSYDRIIGGDVRIVLDDPAQPTLLEAYEQIFAFRQQEYIEKHGYSGTGNMAMRRDIFERVGPFGGIDIAEDAEWGRRAEKLGFSIDYIQELIVYHPARKTFAQLYVKWDRHIEHAFLETSKQPFWRLRWALRAVAVAASGFVDILRRIVASRRVVTCRERWMATCGLIRIRMYRSRRMLQLLFRG